MIVEVGDIIIDKIKDLAFIDKYAGVVKPISYSEVTEDNKTIKKVFPASCKLNGEDCTSGKYHKDLCPDSSKKSVTYLEDKPLRIIKREGDLFYFQVDYDLICWLNIPKLGLEQCSISALIMLAILNELPVVPFNEGIYQRVMINPQGEYQKSTNPFLKYSYDIETHQLLMYPYDYFVMPLQVTFVVNRKCINQLVLADPISCIK